jgi:hypothetical protein
MYEYRCRHFSGGFSEEGLCIIFRKMSLLLTVFMNGLHRIKDVKHRTYVYHDV